MDVLSLVLMTSRKKGRCALSQLNTKCTFNAMFEELD